MIWNPTGTGAVGSASDYWGPTVTPTMTYHCPGSAGDDDNDLVLNALDNAYLTDNPGQDDTDGDGYGDVVDADYDNDDDVDGSDFNAFYGQYGSSGPQSDFNADGDVDGGDFNSFYGKFGTLPPWY